MIEITHEACSERLEAYASGRLDAPSRQEVERHLASCPDCSLELLAVRALADTEVLTMSGMERDRLTSAVRAAVFDAPKPGLRERFGRRFAPALGAVAFIALAAIAFVSLPDRTNVATTSGGGGGDTAEIEGGEVTDSADAETAEAPAPRSKEAGMSEQATTSGGGQGAGGAPALESDAAASAGNTTMAARANFTVPENAFAQSGLEIGALVPVISPEARMDAYDLGVEGLIATAPNRQVGLLASECAELTIATSPHPLVTTSAAYYPDDVLVLGFVWREGSSRLLNYELRGWVGGSCDRISPIYRRGVLE